MAADERHRGNRLLASLPPASLSRLAPLLDIVALTPGSLLAEPGVPLRHAYFPHAGVICLLAALHDGDIEAATVGPEGFVGTEAVLGDAAAGQRVLVQMAGTASRLPVQALRAELPRNPSLQALLLRYVQCFLAQALQSVACNAAHTMRQRCARWLLLAHDRAGTDSFHLTQEQLAGLLGSQRPSVTIVAGALRRAGLIRYRRGQITVTDRAGLEAASCECYGRVRATFEAAFAARPGLTRRGGRPGGDRQG
jgi:CRP-like cAMP-binding protein